MAAVWLSVIVSMMIGQVFARNCDTYEIKSCDECIRCGGVWCNDPQIGDTQCSHGAPDSWCPNNKEAPLSIPETMDTSVYPAYYEKFLIVNKKHMVIKNYDKPPKGEPMINMTLINSTQTDKVQMKHSTKCSHKTGKCTTELWTSPTHDFCLPNGGNSETVYMNVDGDGEENDFIVKYHIPCACQCSEKVEVRSPKCNEKGNMTCGACTCEADRTGTFCEKENCEKKRGDIQCSSSTQNIDCSGNGECGPCDTCVCYKDREGSQYFDEFNCADICTTVNNDDICLDAPVGKCPSSRPIFLQQNNNSLLFERDEFGRKVWIQCNGTTPDGCDVKYAARKDAQGNILLMVQPCKPEAEGYVAGGVNVTVPVILSVLALLAAGSAVAGYIFWKNRVPPVPLTDPQYENIGAEDCTGENPLYRPPTSSFKNPTYGKW